METKRRNKKRFELMKFSKKQLRALIREAFWSKKDIQTIDDVQTVGDLRKLIASAQGAKRWEQTKGEAGSAVKGAVVDEILGKIPGGAAAKTMFSFIKSSYDLPDTARTGTALDALDVDDDVAKIVDDPIENAFLNQFSKDLESLDGDEPLESINMTALLSKYIGEEFNTRTVTGFDEGKKNRSTTNNFSDRSLHYFKRGVFENMSMSARTGAYGFVTFVFESKADMEFALSIFRESMIPTDLSTNRITVDLDDFDEAEGLLRSARLSYKAV